MVTEEEKLIETVKFQLFYMLRPYCKVREKMMHGAIENLKKINISNELFDELAARIIATVDAKKEKREELINQCLDGLDALTRNSGLSKIYL